MSVEGPPAGTAELDQRQRPNGEPDLLLVQPALGELAGDDGALVYRFVLAWQTGDAAGDWRLLVGEPAEAAAAIDLDEQTAWLLLTKGMSAAAARERATVSGEGRLTDAFFGTLAVMA